MRADLAQREDEWIRSLRQEDSRNDYVVSYNYEFERRHDILSEDMRAKFLETQAATQADNLLSGSPSAYELFLKDTIRRDRTFWTAGEPVNVDRPLVMVKHGRTIYFEKWSFLSGLPENPDDDTVMSALDSGSTVEKAESANHRRLRTGAAVDGRLWEAIEHDPVRKMINDDLIAAGQSALLPEEAGSRDSYGRYHDGMATDGYIPIWWVTISSPLHAAIDEAVEDGSEAVTAAKMLGLSFARPGPYYIVTLPNVSGIEVVTFKPTVLSGGFPENYCAVITRIDPGKTARLGDGELGLLEAVMAPISPSQNGQTDWWPALYRLGQIRESVPSANTGRLKQRLINLGDQ